MTQQAFGNRLQALRRAQSLTQEALAQQLGVTNQAVSKWEQGGCYPDITLLSRLADMLHTSTDALLGHAVPHDTPDAVADALRRVLSGRPPDALFALSVQLACVLHEAIATAGYTRRVPWQPREGLPSLDGGFSATTEPEGATVRQGRAVLVSATGGEAPEAAFSHNLRAMLQTLLLPGVLPVLLALSDGRAHTAADLAQAARLTEDAVRAALDAIPCEHTEAGIRLAGCWQSVPAALSTLTY